MSKTMIDPRALNPNWGGVICLNLSSQKPEKFEEIYSALTTALFSKKHYLISVFDEELNGFLGDCELAVDYNREYDTVLIQQVKMRTPVVIDIYQYYFGADGYYYRSVNSTKLNTTI